MVYRFFNFILFSIKFILNPELSTRKRGLREPGGRYAQPEFPEEGKKSLKATLSQTGRSTLRVATWLPISMVIGFALMMLWFKKNGGYKPIILSEEK